MPGEPRRPAAFAGGAPLFADGRRNLESRRAPAEPFARRRDLLGAERGAVALLRAALGRRAEADRGVAGDQRRPLRFLRRSDRPGDRLGIVAVDARRRPARRLEAFHLIDAVGERQRTVDRDAVVVEEHDELSQLEVPGKCDRLLADAFHQIAVGGEHVGRMIDDVAAEQRGEMALGDRHADGIGEALAERPGRGLDAGRVAVFGVPRCERTELAEALDFADRHLLVAEKMKHGIEQHRAVAGGEHEAVAIGPWRIGWIEFQEAREQDRGDVGRAHRQARMAGLRLLDRVHGERANGVGHAVMRGARARRRIRGNAWGLDEVCARRAETVRHRHGAGPIETGQTRRACERPRSGDSMGKPQVKCAAACWIGVMHRPVTTNALAVDLHARCDVRFLS